MSTRLLTVSRAARLVGVSRGTLQKKIQDGELRSFEGLVDMSDLNQAYPQVELEDNTILEKIEEIIDNALKRARGEKLKKLLAPDLSTLAARVSSLSKEMSRLKNLNANLFELITDTQTDLHKLESSTLSPDSIAALRNKIATALQTATDAATADSITVHDTVLRVMAAQVHLMPSGHEFFIEGNTSILEAGLSAGLALDYGCSNGNCGKCKAKLISGEVKKTRQHDFSFSEADKNQGYILTCSNTAITDIVLQAEEASDVDDISLQKVVARVRKIEKINENLAVLHVRTPRTKRLRFLAGQRASLSAVGFDASEYHIASCPCDDMNLQFHICRDNDKEFAQHIFQGVQASESITLEGPRGKFILYEDYNRPLIFLAFHTGFAPIKSLIEHALTLDSNEFSHLYWFHHSENVPYMHNLARSWGDAFDNFIYTPIQLDKNTDDKNIKDKLQQINIDYPDLPRFDIYVCGSKQEVDIATDYLKNLGVADNQLITESLN